MSVATKRWCCGWMEKSLSWNPMPLQLPTIPERAKHPFEWTAFPQSQLTVAAETAEEVQLLWSVCVYAQDRSTYIWCGQKESSFSELLLLASFSKSVFLSINYSTDSWISSQMPCSLPSCVPCWQLQLFAFKSFIDENCHRLFLSLSPSFLLVPSYYIIFLVFWLLLYLRRGRLCTSSCNMKESTAETLMISPDMGTWTEP